MKVLHKICVFVFFVVVAPSVYAQVISESNLILRCVDKGAIGYKIDDPDNYGRKMIMEFENKGKTPFIIINPTLGYGTGLSNVAFFFPTFNEETRNWDRPVNGFSKKIELDQEKKKSFRDAVDVFDAEKPPENFTITLGPGEKYRFEEIFSIEIADQYTVSLPYIDPVTNERKDRKVSKRAQNAEQIQLTYEFSFLPFVADPDFLEKLSLRWKKYGRLPVGTNGTYTITSEPIK